jgi:hypothetical protein
LNAAETSAADVNDEQEDESRKHKRFIPPTHRRPSKKKKKYIKNINNNLIFIFFNVKAVRVNFVPRHLSSPQSPTTSPKMSNQDTAAVVNDAASKEPQTGASADQATGWFLLSTRPRRGLDRLGF